MNQWGVIWSVRDSFIAGLFATLELFITAALAALIIGIALCYFSEYQKKVINWFRQPDARDPFFDPRLSSVLRTAAARY